jgi:hypothetical protein
MRRQGEEASLDARRLSSDLVLRSAVICLRDSDVLAALALSVAAPVDDDHLTLHLEGKKTRRRVEKAKNMGFRCNTGGKMSQGSRRLSERTEWIRGKEVRRGRRGGRMRVNLAGETWVALFWNEERERDGEKAHEGLATAESQQTMMKPLKIFARVWERSGG